jgi:hypothetical protein
VNHIGDVNKLVSDTPRTDQQNDDLLNSDSYTSWLEMSGFARKLERELNAANERIKQLKSWIESLEVLEQHSGILPERQWFGSEIGYLRKGEAVYKGEDKP